MKLKRNEDSLQEFEVKRSNDNTRIRPTGGARHDPFSYQNHKENDMIDLIFSTDLEWLSLNWRKYRASMLNNSLK